LKASHRLEKRKPIYKSEMALHFECTHSCARIRLDTADIVRDCDFSPTEKRSRLQAWRVVPVTRNSLLIGLIRATLSTMCRNILNPKARFLRKANRERSVRNRRNNFGLGCVLTDAAPLRYLRWWETALR